MFKIALVGVLSLGLLQQGEVMPQITISPIPPVQGQQAFVDYDGPLPADVTVSFKPSSIPDMHLHIGPSGQVEFTVPSNGESMTVSDDAGIAKYDSTLIKPSS